MQPIRNYASMIAAVGLAAGSLLAASPQASATTSPTCDSGPTLYCQGPGDAAYPGDEVWMVSPYSSMTNSYELVTYRNSFDALYHCTSFDVSRRTVYYFTVTYTDTSGVRATSNVVSAQCMTIQP